MTGPPGTICGNCAAAEAADEWAHRADSELTDAGKSVPEEYRGTTFADARLERLVGPGALSAARALVRRSAVIYGPSGAGKTRLAVAVFHAHLSAAAIPPIPADLAAAEAQLAAAASSRYVRAHRLARALDWTPEARAYRIADLLLIDDLGLGFDGPAEVATLCDLIIDRADCRRPTLVTTSLAPEAIATRYGDGVARRLFSRSDGIILGGAR